MPPRDTRIVVMIFVIVNGGNIQGRDEDNERDDNDRVDEMIF